MFTGIVQDKVLVHTVQEEPHLKTLTLSFSQALLAGLQLGASVAVEGCCLTVVAIDGQLVRFQIIQETLDRTMLGDLKASDWVNVERSARFGDEIGGHCVSGHIHTVATITHIERSTNSHIVTLSFPISFMPYIFSKGFISLAGCSLTLVGVDRLQAHFSVHLIPETLARTTWASKKIGDRVNVELDQQTMTIVDTVNTYMKSIKPYEQIN